MSRMPLVTSTTTAAVDALLSRTRAALGRLPNLYAALANSPAALAGYLGFREPLTHGQLPVAMQESIALLVAEHNQCDYCVSAHTFRGAKLGIPGDVLVAARRGEALDPRSAAALAFCHAVLGTRGDVPDPVFAAAREAGWSDGDLLEMVAQVALNIFSNYVNHVARPPLDFPAAPPAAGRAP